MDTLVQHTAGHRLCVHQPLQTRNPFQDLNARTAESLVRAPRHCLHDVLCPARGSHGNGRLSAVIKKTSINEEELDITDNLVYVGLSFVTLGMLMGALWAKEAWGHYWAWDPKETWAAITWLSYLAYIHYRRYKPTHPKPALAMLIACFCLLQMCWWGINYLPSAQGVSVHTYSME